jgi:hypothetical protein
MCTSALFPADSCILPAVRALCGFASPQLIGAAPSHPVEDDRFLLPVDHSPLLAVRKVDLSPPQADMSSGSFEARGWKRCVPCQQMLWDQACTLRVDVLE